MGWDWERGKRYAAEYNRKRWPFVKAQLILIAVVSVLMAVYVVVLK